MQAKRLQLRWLSRCCLGTVVLATATLVPSSALAWVFDIGINATVNGHKFRRISAEGEDSCGLKLKLYFTAPETGYQSRAKNRNYHRFRARVLFKNGKVAVTPVFGNRAPGRRVYTYRHDTTHDACWSKDQVEIKSVDIEGCRSEGCKVDDFSRLIPDYDK